MNTDAICGALSVCQDSEILMITSKGQAVRCPVLNIRETSRGSKGVKLVDLAKGDKLIGISEVVELDEENLEPEGENSLSEVSVSLDEAESVSLDEPEPQSDSSDDSEDD